MIPMLEKNISLAESILKKDANNKELQSLLESQKNTLEKYKERIGVDDKVIQQTGHFIE